MAALSNVQLVSRGKDYALSMYVDALRLLNQALQDPIKSKTDETLIAVIMLGYYENISSDSRQSIQSWKAHINGAAQLLKLRGKQQFQTHIGRTLYRETRAQILSHCLWNYEEAPKFLQDYQVELDSQTPEEFATVSKTIDKLTTLFFRFTRLRGQIFARCLADVEAAKQASNLERRLVEWSENAVRKGEFWQYNEIEVDHDEHVWDCKVLTYSGHPAPFVWNSWRCLRIMLSRTQEMLCHRSLDTSEEECKCKWVTSGK